MNETSSTPALRKFSEKVGSHRSAKSKRRCAMRSAGGRLRATRNLPRPDGLTLGVVSLSYEVTDEIESGMKSAALDSSLSPVRRFVPSRSVNCLIVLSSDA